MAQEVKSVLVPLFIIIMWLATYRGWFYYMEKGLLLKDKHAISFIERWCYSGVGGG